MPSDPYRRRSDSPAHGYSLLEVVAAIALMAVALTPALALIRDGMELSQETDRRQLLALHAVSQLEHRMADTAAFWTTGNSSGDYSAAGMADLRYDTACSDLEVSGGVPGLLMDIRTTAYFDDDGDDTLDADELSCTFRTKVGRFASYETLAL